MKISVEQVANGYIVRDEDGDESTVFAGDNDMTATQEMLFEVLDRLGPPTSGWEAETVRVIVLPGRKWLPARRGECQHPWIEGFGPTTEPPRWWCPCGAEFMQLTEGGSLEREIAGPADRSVTRRTLAEEADWKVRGWAPHEISSIYAMDIHRYVVSLIVTYDDSKRSDRKAGIENIHSPATAAAATLDLTRDAGSAGTVWRVFDRKTGKMHSFAQREFEGS